MDREQAWALFFSSVVALQFHPGVKERLSMEVCASIADEMLVHLDCRREALCRG